MTEAADELFAAVCLRNLIAVDTTLILEKETTEDALKALSAKNGTHLFSKLFTLPSEMSDEGRLVTIPIRQTFPIPRQRKIPVEKPKTRWEKFAIEQGIQKQKRSRMIWDETKKDWLPRHGAGSSKNLRQKAEEAIIEMNPGEDLRTVIETRRSEGKLSKKKQDVREVRNKVEGAGGKMPRSDPGAAIASLANDDRKKGKVLLEEMNRRAATSTASFGIHDKAVDVSNKKKVKKLLQKKGGGKKTSKKAKH